MLGKDLTSILTILDHPRNMHWSVRICHTQDMGDIPPTLSQEAISDYSRKSLPGAISFLPGAIDFLKVVSQSRW